MRYRKGQREETRQHIIDVAAKRFREDGIAAAGIARLMADAGLTNGAFYTHFESKEDLVRETLRETQERRRTMVESAIDDGADVETWLRRYLSPRHRDHPGDGCAASTLVAEIARHPEATRDVFHIGYERMIAIIARGLPFGTSEQRRATALALYGLMIGTLQLARAAGKNTESDAILESGVQAGLKLVEADRPRR